MRSVQELREELIKQMAIRDTLTKELEGKTKERDRLVKERELLNKSSLLLLNVSTEVKEKTIKVLEEMVTRAIRTISDRDYSFKIKIEETKKGQKCEFYISELINGVESLQSPGDSCGGGFIDIISTTLRYVYLNAFKAPSINGPMILDEPSKMLSKDMSQSFASFIKALGQEFDTQTILITHDKEIANISDNVIIISENGDYYE